MKPVAVIEFAERKNRRDPIAVYIVTEDRIVATGDPDFAASADCESLTSSLNAKTEEDRRAAVVDFLDRQQRPNVNALPPEVIQYSGAGKARVDRIAADFLERRADRVLKKK